jgi:hypothetical protein
MVFFWALGCSSWFLGILGTEVDDAGMVLGDVASRHCITWLLSLPMWGLMWMG